MLICTRGRIFYYLYSTYLITEFIAPWLASITMDLSILIPFILSILFLLLCLPIVAMIPDTRLHNSCNESTDIASTADRSVDSIQDVSGLDNVSQIEHSNADSLLDKFRSSNMVRAMPVFLVGLLRPSTLNVLIQYTSNYFNWRLSKASLLVSEVAAVNLVLFLVIVPQGMKIVRAKYHVDQQVLDLAVVRSSLLFLTVGALLLGLAPNIPSIVICISGLWIPLTLIR